MKEEEAGCLPKRWNIDRKKALKTVKYTNQRGIRRCLHPSLSRRYPTNDRMMRYNRLFNSMFSDTMKSGVVSKRGNKYGQAYCTKYRWSRCHPMKLNSEAHEYLSMLFKRDGVPPKSTVNNSKDKSLGKFARKCREADCQLVNTEPYYPWSMASKGCIKHLNQGLSRKILKSASPKQLWDNCIELEALIRSNNVLDIYGIEGQVPETVLTGQTGDISNLCKYEWFQWVIYYQP